MKRFEPEAMRGTSLADLKSKHAFSDKLAKAILPGGFPPPDGARQMVHEDPANKKGQRVWSEGKLGTITDTATNNGYSIYCKIQYDDGSKNRDTGGGYLRFANAPGNNSWDTIPC